jgi:hypothetical protein
LQFDGKRAKEIAEKISFPRLSGTEGEEKAREFINNFVEDIGFTPEVEEFSFSLLPAEFFLKFSQIMVGLLCASALFLFNRFKLLSFIVAIVLIYIIIRSTRWSSFIESLFDIKFFRIKSSNTFFKKVLHKNYPNVVFLAHYDSKSQTYPIILRIVLNLAGLIFILFSIILIVIGTIFDINFSAQLLLIPGIFSLLPFLLLIFNFTHNKSPGAIDNASGVAVVLHLAEILKECDCKANLYFLLTGAEELGLAGAIRFIQKHEVEFAKEKTFFINFDSIGKEGNLIMTARYGIPPFCSSKKLRFNLHEILNKRGVKFHDTYLPVGAALDSIPIGTRGYEAITISWGGVKKAGRSVHSKHDTALNLSEETLKITGEVALELLEKIMGN